MKKSIIWFIILGLIVVFLVIYIQQKQETEIQELKPLNIVTSEVNYFENAKGYLAIPSTPGKYPGLILIHEWWGLNDNIKNLADQFADQGYIVLAVDLYEVEYTSDPNVARELASSVRNDMDKAFDNLKSAVNYLESHPNVEMNKLASVGWCFGGGWSYEMAKNDLGIQSSVIYYGRFNPEDDLSRMRATILGHFGEDDASIKVDDVKEFQATLKTLSGEHQIFIYPNSGHGFANEDSPSYVKESAELAWERTLEFLDKELKSEITTISKYELKDCVPTGQDVQGPYLISDIPFRENLAPPDYLGDRLIIKGTVLEGDCSTPIPNTTLTIWHTDENGRYDDNWYRGKVRTDEQGKYDFVTVRPGKYAQGFSARPAHIHIKVESEDHTTLTTQLYFSGDSNLAPNDPCSACRSDDPTHIIDLEQYPLEGISMYTGEFRIILESKREL